jgi:hypothetical protein
LPMPESDPVTIATGMPVIVASGPRLRHPQTETYALAR